MSLPTQDEELKAPDGIARRPCRGCGVPIFFAWTPEGKKIPLDPRSPTYALVRDLTGELKATRTEAWVSHYATCPKANDFSASNRR